MNVATDNAVPFLSGVKIPTARDSGWIFHTMRSWSSFCGTDAPGARGMAASNATDRETGLYIAHTATR